VGVDGAIAIAILLSSGCCCLASLAIVGAVAYALLKRPTTPVARAPAPIVEHPPIVEPPKVAPVVEAKKSVVVEEVAPPKIVEAMKAVVETAPPHIETGASLPPERPVEPGTFSSRTMIPPSPDKDAPPPGATIMVPPPVPLEGDDPATDVPEPPRALGGRSPTIVPEDVKPGKPGEE
jgi:hypothetical protein